MCNRSKQFAVSNRLRGMEGYIMKDTITIRSYGVDYEVEYHVEYGIVYIGVNGSDQNLIDAVALHIYRDIEQRIESAI